MNQGGWCWRFWEHGGELITTPFWCHHTECRAIEAELTEWESHDDDWWLP